MKPVTVANRQMRRQIDELLSERALLQEEAKSWREAVVLLIESMPQPFKSVVCAQLATIPRVWSGLSAQSRRQAKKVLADWTAAVADTSKEARR